MLISRSISLAQYQPRTAHEAVGRHPKDVAHPVVPPRPHSRQQVVRRCGGILLIRPPGEAVKLPRVEAVQRCQRSWR